MGKTVIPEGYRSLLSLYETQKAISLLKRLFEDRLAGALRLHRVSAPLFVSASSGLNDDLNGVERPVSFEINRVEDTAQVVHSWPSGKRLALKRYQFHPGEGLYTDMNAIRRDEELDNLHSAYVDQWDWEKIITQEDRTWDYLKQTVNAIVRAPWIPSPSCAPFSPSCPPCPSCLARSPSSPPRTWRIYIPSSPPRSGRTPLSGSTVRCFSWGSAES